MMETESIPKSRLEDNIIEFLREVPLFDGFETDELSIIAKHMNLIGVEKGERLFNEGENGDYVCFVLEGNLDVIKKTENN